MKNFNQKLVESLDVINKVMAGFFAFVTVVTLFVGMFINFGMAIISACSVMVTGVLVCGTLALLININNNIQAMRDDKENIL